MGLLVDGVWHKEALLQKTENGAFKRSDSSFRNWITADGAPGPSGDGGFKAEAGRYHLYISHACPWAHRTAIFRVLKGLQDMISLSVTHWDMGEMGWSFAPGEGVVPDPENMADYIHQIYQAADNQYNGRATVPVLWDKQQKTIVSNESAEIIRMFNAAFDHLGAKGVDYYPAHLQVQIDDINERVYAKVNNGVYRAGFAQTQQAYEEAVYPLFETLDWLEDLLEGQRYLAGEMITEADWRLFTTLLRFDPVYAGHFKCNLHRIEDYPNLSNYLRELYQVTGVAQTVDMDHIKSHYYGSQKGINPTAIVPAGPVVDLTRPHNRSRLKAA